MPDYFIKGFLIALIFGIPAGAIGALTIQRSLEKGFWAGLFTGLGSSVADVLYACVGVFGVTIISDFLTSYQGMIQLLGGILISLMGIMTLRKKAAVRGKEQVNGNYFLYFISSFSIAILNPATILSFMLAFTTFDITGVVEPVQGALLITGILLGTVCWWAGISGVATAFRKRITDRIYILVNRLLGVVLTGFGIVILLRGILQVTS